MATTITHKVIAKYKSEDHLVTKVVYLFSGDVNDEVTVDVYHYRPTKVADIEATIIARGETEEQKLLAKMKIDDILDEIVIDK